jgi:hypothetical protein
MSKRTRAATETVERTVAHIARYAYDFFMFSPSPAATARPSR